jgi:hypothetical protein
VCGGDSNTDRPSSSPTVAAVELRQAPRSAAATDRTLWQAWTEAAGNAQEVIAARVDAGGRVARRTMAPRAAGFVIEPQIGIAGDAVHVLWSESVDSSQRARLAAWTGSA